LKKIKTKNLRRKFGKIEKGNIPTNNTNLKKTWQLNGPCVQLEVTPYTPEIIKENDNYSFQS
jgi:hypothetical protein